MQKRIGRPRASRRIAASLSETLNVMVREKLKERGWSQKDLAKRLGLTQSAISFMLQSKRRAGALNFYERLATVFDVRLSVLIHRVEVRAGVAVPRHDPLVAYIEREREAREEREEDVEAILRRMIREVDAETRRATPLLIDDSYDEAPDEAP